MNFFHWLSGSVCQWLGRPVFILRSSHTKDSKWYLIPPCLTLSIIRYVSRVKWSNPEKGVAPSPTPLCSSYWKGSFRVGLDYGRQLYFSFSALVVFKIFMGGTLFYFVEHYMNNTETYQKEKPHQIFCIEWDVLALLCINCQFLVIFLTMIHAIHFAQKV